MSRKEGQKFHGQGRKVERGRVVWMSRGRQKMAEWEGKMIPTWKMANKRREARE